FPPVLAEAHADEVRILSLLLGQVLVVDPIDPSPDLEVRIHITQEALRKNNLLRHPVDREILATHVMGPGGRGKAPAQGLLDLRAKAERFFHPWAADPPITVEPHPRRLLLEVRRKV